MTELIKYNNAIRWLAEAHSVDEVKDFRDKAMAMEAYARQALNLEAERQAVDIRIRAEREAGKLMKAMGHGQGVRMNGKDDRGNYRTDHAEPPDQSEYATAKQSAKISDSQAKRWQALADVSDDQFEDAMKSPEKPTTTGIIQKTKEQPKGPPMNPNALWLLGRLRDFEAHSIRDENREELINGMTDGMRETVKRIVPVMIDFLSEIEEIVNEKQYH